MKRSDVLVKAAVQIQKLEKAHPLRVGIDGIDAAGKTTFADALGSFLSESGRNVIRASIDGFHNPRAVRYRRGGDSPEGYYLESFNYEVLRGQLLHPLGPQGDLRYIRKSFDYETDQAVQAEVEQARSGDIMVFDGIFLFRPELLDCWDFKIFLDISFETSLMRALQRDGYLFGAETQIRKRYLSRYIPGQQLYFQQADPKSKADIVIDNNDPDRLGWIGLI